MLEVRGCVAGFHRDVVLWEMDGFLRVMCGFFGLLVCDRSIRLPSRRSSQNGIKKECDISSCFWLPFARCVADLLPSSRALLGSLMGYSFTLQVYSPLLCLALGWVFSLHRLAR